MADIHIVQEHHLTHKKAREAAEKVAEKLAEEFELTCKWDEDVLHFERGGVSGKLTLHKHKAEMKLKLGFMFSMFASTIEEKVTEKMKKVFAGK